MVAVFIICVLEFFFNRLPVAVPKGFMGMDALTMYDVVAWAGMWKCLVVCWLSIDRHPRMKDPYSTDSEAGWMVF